MTISSSAIYAQQFLPVKGIVNARDLGGNEIPGGLRVKMGRLLRTAHLADATSADLSYLNSLSIGVVVDFRKEDEKQGKADKAIPGAEYISLPIDTTGAVSKTATEEEKKKFTRRKKFDVKKLIVMAAFNEKAKAVAQDMYPTLLFYPECQSQMAAFLRLVVDKGDKPILFHCTQGKDRTGIASALLLAALGADRQTIIADFDATNLVYEKDVRKYSRRVKFWGGKEDEVGVVKAFLGANTENFVKALDAIDAQYGSLDAFLQGPMGLTDADIRTLRERYLDSRLLDDAENEGNEIHD